MARLSFRPSGLLLVALLAAPVAAARADNLDGVRALIDETEELAGLKDELGKLNPIAGGWNKEFDFWGVKASLYIYFPGGGASRPVIALLLPSVALSTIIPPLEDTPMDVTLDDPVVFSAGEGFLHIDKMPPKVAERTKALGFAEAFRVEKGTNVFGRVAGHGDGLHEILQLINLKGPLVAGYSTTNHKKDAQTGIGAAFNDPIGLAGGDKVKDKVISLTLAANTTWSEPLFFKHTEILQASIQMRSAKKPDLKKDPNAKKDTQSQLRVLGRAKIGAKAPKEYDLYLEKTFDKKADPKNLGILVAVNPTGEVVLTDFFAVSQALAATLGLPAEVLGGGHALPLDEIKLRNPHSAKEAFPEEGAPPDFTKVMFAGANQAAKLPFGGKLGWGPLATVNADAKVFGFDAAGLEGYFSIPSGIKIDAKARLPKLGPITVANAAFDTAVTLKTAFMKLHVDALSVGKFDVDASSKGLSFAIPPQCPGKPVGFLMSLDGFDLSKDFSARPQMKDCLTPIVKDLIEDGSKAVQVAGDIAGDAAEDAAGIAKAADGAADLAKKRADAWGKAIANKVHAGRALDDAKAAISGLEGAVKDLEGQIESVTHDIDKLLRKLWALVKGEVKDKKRHRQHLVADRDDKRTQLAAANQREKQAEKAAADIPVPYHDDALRKAQADELGARVVKAQQTRFAEQARGLPETLKSLDGRKALFNPDAVVAQAEAAFVAEQKAVLRQRLLEDAGRRHVQPQNPRPDPSHSRPADPKPHLDVEGPAKKLGLDDPRLRELGQRDLTLTDLAGIFGTLDAAARSPIPGAEGVAASAVGARLDSIREKILREEVPNLPSMAFDKKVLLQTTVNGTTLCVTQRDPYDTNISKGLLLKPCDGSARQELVFHDTGLIEVPATAIPGGWNPSWGKRPCVGMAVVLKLAGDTSCQKDQPTGYLELGTRFFHDPLDGMIRTGSLQCLNPVVHDGQEPAVTAALCPGSMTDDQIAVAKRRNNPVPPDSIPAWSLVDAEQFRKAAQQPHAATMAAGPLHGVAAGRPAAPRATNLAPLSLD